MTTIDHAAEAQIDHRRTAEEANREAMRRKGADSRRWHRKAQVHATLALVEQQRIANLIALGQYTTAPGDMPVYRAVIWEGDDLREDIRKGLGL